MSDLDARDREVPDTGQAREPDAGCQGAVEKLRQWGDPRSGFVDAKALRVVLREMDRLLKIEEAAQPRGDRVVAGQVADLRDDLARLDAMIMASPAEYPGLPLIRRHRDEVRALLGTETGRPAGEMPTGQAFLDEFYTPSLLSRDTTPEDRP